MKKRSILGACLIIAFGNTAAISAPVYLNCVAFGKEFKDGQVNYAFTLNESDQSASKTVKETGYTRARLVAAFSPDEVTIHEPGDFETDDFTINRSSLKLKIMTTRDKQTYDGGSGICKVATAPKRQF